MALKTLRPPCYNDGDEKLQIHSTDSNLRTLEMFARLSGMECDENIYYSYDTINDEALLIILDNTAFSLTKRIYEKIKNCTGTLNIKGRINREFSLVEAEYASKLKIKRIILHDLDT